MKLLDVADVRTNFPNADFWVPRMGELKGKPVHSFDEGHIGVFLVRRDLIDPKTLFYAVEMLWAKGAFSSGVRTVDVQNISLEKM